MKTHTDVHHHSWLPELLKPNIKGIYACLSKFDLLKKVTLVKIISHEERSYFGFSWHIILAHYCQYWKKHLQYATLHSYFIMSNYSKYWRHSYIWPWSNDLDLGRGHIKTWSTTLIRLYIYMPHIQVIQLKSLEVTMNTFLIQQLFIFKAVTGCHGNSRYFSQIPNRKGPYDISTLFEHESLYWCRYSCSPELLKQIMIMIYAWFKEFYLEKSDLDLGQGHSNFTWI